MQSQLYRNSRESRIFDAANLVFLTLLAALTLYPLVYTVVVSLSAAYVANPYFYLWPVGANLGAYEAVLGTGVFWRAFLNSVFYTACASLLGIALTLMTAYPLSIASFPLRNFFMFFITFTILFNGGLIPYYLVVRALGMLNTPWAMIVPGALSAFNVVVARTYLQANIPPEIREAARVDGAGDWTILLRIVLPLSAPIIAVVGLFSAVSHWNSYYWALIFLNRVELYPVSLLLRDIVVGVLAQGQTDPGLSGVASPNAVRAATLIVAMLPIMAVYPFLQRYFVKGLTIGAIKG